MLLSVSASPSSSKELASLGQPDGELNSTTAECCTAAFQALQAEARDATWSLCLSHTDHGYTQAVTCSAARPPDLLQPKLLHQRHFCKCTPPLVPVKRCGGEDSLSWRCSGYTRMTMLSQTRGSFKCPMTDDHTSPFSGCSHVTLRLRNGSKAPPKQLHQFKREFWGSADISARLQAK